MYGRDLGQDEDFVSEERFDKIRFYLKNGKYPNGADRAEKSRLRSAATHYKLIPAQDDKPELLMLKGKEVISDPQRQYEVARQIHHRSHGGINKTTASIAESYHWVRIKETVSQVIRNCPECSEMNKNLVNNRNVLASNGNPQYLEPLDIQATTLPPSQPVTSSNREESPSTQLQLEAGQQQTQHHNQHQQQLQQHQPQTHGFPNMPDFSAYDLPVDPALMNGAHHNMNHNPNSLQDLPPSPFLAASRNLNIAPMPNLEMSLSDLQSSGGMAQQQDINMTDIVAQERAPNGREEIRRRLTRAGYNAQQT